MADKRPSLTNGRRPRKGEAKKRQERLAKRAESWKIKDDGAGAQSIDDPKRHHRQ